MTADDAVIKQYREQISDNDLKILEALNKRIQLVAKLKGTRNRRASASWIRRGRTGS